MLEAVNPDLESDAPPAIVSGRSDSAWPGSIALWFAIGITLFWYVGVAGGLNAPIAWWTFVISLIPFAAVAFLVWYVRSLRWHWLRLAQRPLQEIKVGCRADAERAYAKALAYANSHSPNHARRGVMLRELGLYHLVAGHDNEARGFLHGSVVILERYSRQKPYDFLLALNYLAVYLIKTKDYQTAERTLERFAELSPVLRTTKLESRELDFLFQLNLTFFCLKVDRPNEALDQIRHNTYSGSCLHCLL